MSADVALPAGLERYLTPELWRQIADSAGRRGLLLNALHRLSSVLYLLSIHLPAHLVQYKARRPQTGQPHVEWLSGSLLFADVSGFTALSERLAAQGRAGAEQLTDLMNGYFDCMLDILARSGGILVKFAGDALLAYFAAQEAGAQAAWAERTARRMIHALPGLPSLDPPLSMKIGISTGSFLSVGAGSASRMEYAILGETVARTMAAEGLARAGQVVVDEATARCLDPAACLSLAAGDAPGFFVLGAGGDGLDDFEIRSTSRRGRGAIPWDASPAELVADLGRVLEQIQALAPYLAPELVAAIVDQAQERCLPGEYRPTATLFVNLVGLEPLLAAGGERAAGWVLRVFNDYFRAMQCAIARHGGVISRIDPYRHGSKMLVLFGAPVAHGDDPVRAVGAALAMADELAGLNTRWQRVLPRRVLAGLPGPLAVEQRIGITYGRTFAGQVGSSTRREYTVMGDDVNLAARLMAAAGPGEVLVSQPVSDRIVDHYASQPLPAIRVKGKAEPVAVYRPGPPRDDLLARRLRIRGPLLGRLAELQFGQERVDAALEGQGGLLLVRGAVGVGKSRLADELAAYALARGAVVRVYLCQSHAATEPYASWRRLLAGVLGLPAAGDGPARGRALLHGLAGLGLAAAGHTEPLARLLGLPDAEALDSPPWPAAAAHAPGNGGGSAPRAALYERLGQALAERPAAHWDMWQTVEQRRRPQAGGLWQDLQRQLAARELEGLFRAVSAVLNRLAAAAPLIVVFDNAQWLDPSSAQLCHHLGLEAASQRLLLLLVQRSDEAAADLAGPGSTLDLGPLEPAAGRALIEQLLDGTRPSAGLIDAVYDTSGGNPLLIEEIVGSWRRTGRLDLAAQSAGRLADLMLSRLDRLAPRQRQVAKTAAVIGAEFHRGELSCLLPALADERAWRAALCGLEKAQFVLLLQPGSDAQYGFRQTLIRDVVYDVLPFARRRELHAALAAYLEAGGADDPAPWAELLAYHWQQAGRPLDAARWLIRAGQQARERYAYGPAAGAYSRALSILEVPQGAAGSRPADEVAILLARAHEGQGDVALLAGDAAAALAAYGAARRHAAGTPGPGLLVKLALALAAAAQGQEIESAAEDAAGAAWAVAAPQGDLAAAACLAWLLQRRGDAGALAWIVRARAGLPAPEARDRWQAGVAALLADVAGDTEAAWRGYRALPTSIARRAAVLAACRLGDRHLAAGRAAEAESWFDRAADAAGQESDADGLALARFRQAEARLRLGRAAEAHAAFDEAWELTRAGLALAPEDCSALGRARDLVHTGQPDAWPAWCWQRYEDWVRLSMLFRP